MNKPRFYRPSKGNVWSWEIWSWQTFFITFAPGRWEFEISRYPKQQKTGRWECEISRYPKQQKKGKNDE